MALDMTPEQKEVGKANFQRAVGELGLTRRDFMKGLLAAGAVLPISAAAYYGYSHDKLNGKPVKAALIGAGDEGGVLIGEHNPKYLEFIAVCDIRPTNQDRIFKDEREKNPASPRKGLEYHYGADARQKIKLYDDYKKMLDEVKDIEAVVIALPLFLHAPVAIDCMKAGKHVLCEKLMAWNINQCKEMIKAADDTDRILCIGHQRHYSLLYAHALEVMQAGILGDVKHIRALWHRNNALPKLDANGKEIPGTIKDGWKPDVAQRDREALEHRIRQLGYKNMEELVRWRLFNRTGGGLMAELGSHQLDACSIFLGKVHPLAVSGVGGKYFYRDDREVDDHVFVTFEFPGQHYYKNKERTEIGDKNDIVVVTYSSINTNSFEPYGECVMGSRGTMVVESEQKVMLYTEGGAARSTAVTVASAGGGKPALDSSATTGPSAAAALETGGKAIGPVSRGYREEMEHFAYCVRMWDQVSKAERPLPRCHGRVAMADAIIALTSNLAMNTHQRIEFKPEWFEAGNPAVPDPDMKPEIISG
jgi:predicted dehydrogenase